MGFWKSFINPRRAKLEREANEMLEIQQAQRRQMLAEIKRLEHETRVLQQKQEIARLEQEIAELKGEDDDEEEEGETDNIFLNTILQKFLNPQAQQGSVSSVSGEVLDIPPMQGVTLTDEQITATLKSLPAKYLKMARFMPDETLKGVISKQGNFSEDTIARAIKQIRKI